MASGVFDILHLGHILYLRESRRLGDSLIVVVARDATAKRMKHRPVVPEDKRLEMIKELRSVDKAILGVEGDMYDTVRKIAPDIISLGFDQAHREKEIRDELEKRGIDCRVVRLEKYASDMDSTSRLIEQIISWADFNKKMSSVEGK